ncbi:hypothetical protein [Shewanella phage FishSpeaker]|nr:hypothetical protein [Shewanella phage FishSpeaker]
MAESTTVATAAEDKNKALRVVAARQLLCLILRLPRPAAQSTFDKLGAGKHPLDTFLKLDYNTLCKHIVATRKRVYDLNKHLPAYKRELPHKLLEHYDLCVPLNKALTPNSQWRSLESETRILLRVIEKTGRFPTKHRLSAIQSDLEGKLILDVLVSVRTDHILLKVFTAKNMKHPMFKISNKEKDHAVCVNG